MKINFAENAYVNFDQIKVGEIFETDGTFYLKVGYEHAFDLVNNRLQYCEGWDTLIPRESELTVY